jgi:hypothetical protein
MYCSLCSMKRMHVDRHFLVSETTLWNRQRRETKGGVRAPGLYSLSMSACTSLYTRKKKAV